MLEVYEFLEAYLVMSQKKSRQQKKPKSEIKLAEERFQSCVVKRNNFNDEARSLRDERNALHCLLYTSPSPRDRQKSRMPSSA